MQFYFAFAVCEATFKPSAVIHTASDNKGDMRDCNYLRYMGLDAVTWEVFPSLMSLQTTPNPLTEALDFAKQFDTISVEDALHTK